MTDDRRPIKDQGDPLNHAAREASGADENEGEGNKTADRHYRDGVKRTVQSGDVERKAKEAERAYEGPEGEALRRAEEAGKKHSHGEDPALRKKP